MTLGAVLDRHAAFEHYPLLASVSKYLLKTGDGCRSSETDQEAEVPARFGAVPRIGEPGGIGLLDGIRVRGRTAEVIHL
jgi:hypothetical protein